MNAPSLFDTMFASAPVFRTKSEATNFLSEILAAHANVEDPPVRFVLDLPAVDPLTIGAPEPSSAAHFTPVSPALEIAVLASTNITVSGRVYVYAWNTATVGVSGSASSVMAHDQVTVMATDAEVIATDSARVGATGRSRVTVRGRATATVHGDTSFIARDDARLTAHDNSFGRVEGHAIVHLHDEVAVGAYDQSAVVGGGHTRVHAHDESRWIVSDHGQVKADGQSTGEASQLARVWLKDSANVAAIHQTFVHLEGPDTRAVVGANVQVACSSGAANVQVQRTSTTRPIQALGSTPGIAL